MTTNDEKHEGRTAQISDVGHQLHGRKHSFLTKGDYSRDSSLVRDISGCHHEYISSPASFAFHLVLPGVQKRLLYLIFISFFFFVCLRLNRHLVAISDTHLLRIG